MLSGILCDNALIRLYSTYIDNNKLLIFWTVHDSSDVLESLQVNCQ